VRSPALDSADMHANFDRVTQLCDTSNPQQSKFYLQAITRHASGSSAVVSTDQAKTILDWISGAKAVVLNTPTTKSCADVKNFNVGVFQHDIEPILFGQIDLNNPGSTRVTSGCSRGPCHGTDRGPGTFVVKETATAAENLASFACFVNLQDPVLSTVLACPLDAASCPSYPHPGQNVFGSAADLNYQKVLSYLYTGKASSTPIDFAYFVRRVQPIFDDRANSGLVSSSCSNQVCHGVTVAGQAPSNRSDFPIIANAGDPARLQANFSAAINFTNFLSPTGSSLYLYPTDAIADKSASPFSTGLHHTGGADFAVGSPQATAILSWAGGLRPDSSGVNHNWLVAGTYSAAQISNSTGVDEVNVTPAIFDPMGASQFNGGQWDALISDNATIDLGTEFPQGQTAGRVAYAVAYVLNTTQSDLPAIIHVQSANPIKLYVDKTPVQETLGASQEATAVTTFPAFSTSGRSTRLLLKVLQRSQDAQFNFKVWFTDQNQNILSAQSGELVLKLAPGGGV
jgi:hypothetical protein